MKIVPPLALFFTATAALGVYAGEHRHHDAHLHGEARLDVVLERNELEAELVSPAANLVGFEHPPHDAEERERLLRAAALLRDGARVLGVPAAAGCRAVESEVESALLEEGAHSGDGHAEFHVHYRFQCAKPEALERLGMELFQLFPGIESLRVQAVGPNGQGGAILNAADPEYRF